MPPQDDQTYVVIDVDERRERSLALAPSSARQLAVQSEERPISLTVKALLRAKPRRPHLRPVTVRTPARGEAVVDKIGHGPASFPYTEA